MPFQQIVRSEIFDADDVSQFYEKGLAEAAEAIADIRHLLANAPPPYLALPNRLDDLDQIETLARKIASDFRDVVVLGTGGSSLGAKALLDLKADPFSRDPQKLRVHFPDNLSATRMAGLYERLDLSQTHFIVVSKSGGTAETLAQLLTAWEAVGGQIAARNRHQHFTLICEPGQSPLRYFAKGQGLDVIDHDPALGGRYSVMSIVGLLPAAIGGVDIRAVRKGAQAVLTQAITSPDSRMVPAAVGASAGYALLMAAGCSQQVLMAYDDRLEGLTAWWKQLWAESLGKQGRGTTPLAAMGPVDQHSQVQLFLDGPADKFYSFIAADFQGAGPRVPAQAGEDDDRLGYLAGRTIGDLVTAEAQATVEATVRRGRPTRLFLLPVTDEETVGALMMTSMLETVIMARLIHVDPFDQPAVEDGKVLTREALGAGGINLARDEGALSSLNLTGDSQ